MHVLPKNMQETAFGYLKDEALKKGEKLNVGLVLDKYIHVSSPADKRKSKAHNKIEIKLSNQVYWLTDGPRIPSNLFPEEAFDELSKRIDSIARQSSDLYCSRQETLELIWRLVVNLGAASVYETSILLHRNFSIPYIPGSALKGVCRHWGLLKFSEASGMSLSELERKLYNGESIRQSIDVSDQELGFKDLIDIFGHKNSCGKVIFLDAVPLGPKGRDFLVLDVMNVHYRDYYTKGEIPGDWMDPNPVFFLAVEGLKFKFTLLARKKYESLLDRAMALLIEALEKIGVGAKTSVGYGYFKRIS